MILRQSQDAFRHLAAKRTKIAGIRAQLHSRELIDEPVEIFFEKGQNLPVAPFILVGCDDVELRLGVQNLHHLPHQLRTLLQVCVDQGNVVSLGAGQTGVQTGFLSKVAGKADDTDGAILCGIELFQLRQGLIAAAVVDVDNLICVPAALKSVHDRFLKGCYIFFLVVAWNDQR